MLLEAIENPPLRHNLPTSLRLRRDKLR